MGRVAGKVGPSTFSRRRLAEDAERARASHQFSTESAVELEAW